MEDLLTILWMVNMKIPFIGGSYHGYSRKVNNQETKNFYPAYNQQSAKPFTMYNCEGLKNFLRPVATPTGADTDYTVFTQPTIPPENSGNIDPPTGVVNEGMFGRPFNDNTLHPVGTDIFAFASDQAVAGWDAYLQKFDTLTATRNTELTLVGNYHNCWGTGQAADGTIYYATRQWPGADYGALLRYNIVSKTFSIVATGSGWIGGGTHIAEDTTTGFIYMLSSAGGLDHWDTVSGTMTHDINDTGVWPDGLFYQNGDLWKVESGKVYQKTPGAWLEAIPIYAGGGAIMPTVHDGKLYARSTSGDFIMWDFVAATWVKFCGDNGVGGYNYRSEIIFGDDDTVYAMGYNPVGTITCLDSYSISGDTWTKGTFGLYGASSGGAYCRFLILNNKLYANICSTGYTVSYLNRFTS